jgi:hypothetical protein
MCVWDEFLRVSEYSFEHSYTWNPFKDDALTVFNGDSIDNGWRVQTSAIRDRGTDSFSLGCAGLIAISVQFEDFILTPYKNSGCSPFGDA